MNVIVIYNSQTGFTKKYAEWINEGLKEDGSLNECSCRCLELKEAQKENLLDYDAIVFGGWFMAGSISKVKWFRQQIPLLAASQKKMIVFAVGASPAGSPQIEEEFKRNFSETELSSVKSFYCPGGLNYDRMNFFSRLSMKMLVKILSSKKDASPEEIERAQALASSFDASDKKYIEPILQELKEFSEQTAERSAENAGEDTPENFNAEGLQN